MATTTQNVLDSDDPVCYGCVGDSILAQRIKTEGKRLPCAVCGRRRLCVSISDVGDWLKEVLPSVIHDISSFRHRGRTGDSLTDMIGDLIGLDSEQLAEALAFEVSHLQHHEILDGADAEFSEDGEFVLTRPSERRYRARWREFEASISHRSRFFNADAAAFLRDLFEDVDEVQCAQQFDWPPHRELQANMMVALTPAVRTLYPAEDWSIFRARRVDANSQYAGFKAAPGIELGPPPEGKASAGRMNAEGVAVFYGSSDRETCVSELRPYINATVATAEFRLTRPVRVLDMRVLEASFNDTRLSIFDRRYREVGERRQFLTALHRLVGEPVKPGDEFSYLRTQVLADYLVSLHSPSVQGIIFSSAQRRDGANLVLFASMPPSAVEPRFEDWDPQSEMEDLSQVAPPPLPPGPLALFGLRYVDESLQFLRIEGVNYTMAREIIAPDEMLPGDYEDDDDAF